MPSSSDTIISLNQQLVRVTCEGLPDDFSVDAYWDGSHWNHFLAPLFTLEGGKQLCAVLPEELSYDASRHAFRYEDKHADEPEVLWVHPRTYRIDNELVELFVLGDSWCWELADAEHYAAAPRNGGATVEDLTRFHARYPNVQFRIAIHDNGCGDSLPRLIFTHDGEDIFNPLRDATLCNPVDPVVEYGLQLEDAKAIAATNDC